MSAGKNNLKVNASAGEARQHTRATRHRDPRHTRPVRQELAAGTGYTRGGNHFIELAEDADDAVWVTLHSGSVASATRSGNQLHKVDSGSCAGRCRSSCPDRDLAYYPRAIRRLCLHARPARAQQFALHNRNEMMDRVLTEVSGRLRREGHETELELQRINSHHNFTEREEHFGEQVWVTRKGAIRARKDNWAMIPGSMGTRSYIVGRQGTPYGFHSAPHGAGAATHGTKARSLFSMEDLGPRDGRHRVPALEGAARRDSGGLQGH